MKQKKALEKYHELCSIKNLEGLSSEVALDNIGELCDLSFDLKKIKGLDHAIRLAGELKKRELASKDNAILYYFLANAWHNIKVLKRTDADELWEWEQEEMEMEIIYLRKALSEDGFSELPDVRKCQILTNLGNLFSHIGRFVEEVEYFDRALLTDLSFGMAAGNKGLGLFHYARALYDQGHVDVFLNFAHRYLKNAILSNNIEGSARKCFNDHMALIESFLSQEYLNSEIDMDSFSLGDSKDEIHYREWCLMHQLFLNPLNDIGSYNIGARDILTTPSITMKIGEGPYYPAFYNQLKQEFVSARYLYYEGVNKREVHFSDKDVLLYDTLDYPSYSISIEKVKAAFRMSYSLFDKIAYFLNHYLELGIDERRVTFKTFWYKKQNKKKGLKTIFAKSDNWPLRGLFWLSKDLYENKPDFKESIEPDAQKLSLIRNHIEHKYLKIHQEFWVGSSNTERLENNLRNDKIAVSMGREEFEAKTLRLLIMVRAALIYLSLAIHHDENRRLKARGNTTIPSMPLFTLEDEDKF